MKTRLLNACAVIVLALAVRQGTCIRCYSCLSSENDEKCKYPYKYSARMVECNMQAAAETAKNANNIDPSFYSIYEVDVASQDPKLPMNCLKQVTKVGSKEVILRGCQVAPTEQLNICKKVKEVAKGKSIEVSFCRLCDHDNCNWSPKTYSNALFTVFLSSMALVFAKL